MTERRREESCTYHYLEQPSYGLLVLAVLRGELGVGQQHSQVLLAVRVRHTRVNHVGRLHVFAQAEQALRLRGYMGVV